MSNEVEAQQSHTPVARKAVAGVVLVVAVVVAIKLVIGLVTAIFWPIVGIAIIGAILWAAKTLFW